MLEQAVSAIGRARGVIGAVDLVEVSEGKLLPDATVDPGGPQQWRRSPPPSTPSRALRAVDTTDRTFLLHVGGKIEQRNKHALKTRDDLSMAYTPAKAKAG